MATSWRLESPLVAETSPRRLLETIRVSGESREIETCSIFLETFSSLQQVSETSPRPAGDQGDVAATNPVPTGVLLGKALVPRRGLKTISPQNN